MAHSTAIQHTSLKSNLALITGATSGIGRATADALAARGADLVITGRRKERLDQAAKEISARFGVSVTTLVFDVSDREQTLKALDSLGAKAERITIVVNNAGLARGTQPLPSGEMSDWDVMIDTNIKGLLTVTRWCLPHFLKRRTGHVVNIGSVAGRWVYPGGGVYCATKFAVRALSESLRMDLLGTQIRVTNVEPGMVETEFSEVRFGGDKDKAKAVYNGMTPLTARDIAETVAWCVERPAHVNIQEIVLYPTDQASVGPYVHRQT